MSNYSIPQSTCTYLLILCATVVFDLVPSKFNWVFWIVLPPLPCFMGVE